MSTERRALTVDEALERIAAMVGEPLPAVDVPLPDALGSVLAEPLVSAIDVPPWDNSSMDGFAVRSGDTTGATADHPVTLRVVGDSRAGRHADARVEPGTAVRIATGARIPEGADAVVPVELTLPESGSTGRPDGVRAFGPDERLQERCVVAGPVGQGSYVRPRGDDVREGVVVLDAGTRLMPAHVALAASTGAGTVRVHRPPVVAILSTGDEVRATGEPLGAAGIPDANRPGLLALCRSIGVTTIDLGVVRDSREAVLDALRGTFGRADAVIVTGGVSVGPFDVVRLAFNDIGSVELWRVAVQPGRPFAFGRSEPRPGDGRRVLLFGLPGNPVSAFVTFHLFVEPALVQLSGSRPVRPHTDLAVIETSVRKDRDRRAYLRVVAIRDDQGKPLRDELGRFRVREAGGQGSHILSALAAAEALAIVEPGVEQAAAGSEVELEWLTK